MTAEHNFGALGATYQSSLIKVILTNKKFGATILEILEPHYFDAGSFRYIVQIMRDYYVKYNHVPDYDSVILEINKESKNDTSSKMHLDTIELVKNIKLTNDGQIENTALDFCRQQVMKKTVKVVQTIIDKGDFDMYPKIESIIQEALQVGIPTSDVIDVFENIKDALRADSRRPIPTGVVGLDRELKGGLGKGELGVVLAPTGVGKTTLLTKFGNAGYVDGHKILQIIFEDNVNTILRKHYTIWSKITPDEQQNNEEYVIGKVKEVQKNSNGKLKVLKLPSDSVTISELKSIIRKLAMEGFVPDEILLDYVDCLVPENAINGEEWKGEGNIMRHLEAMTTEFDISMWVATQGNRESIATEVVTTDLMGGSIKKAQIGHVVISAGKTLEQKENKLATLALLKSRIGNDGIVWQNCQFDNEFLIIDTDNQNTLFEHEETEEERKRKRGPEALKESQKKEAERMGDITLSFEFDDARAGIINKEIDKSIEDTETKPTESNDEEKNLKRIKEVMDSKPNKTTLQGIKTQKTENKRVKMARKKEEDRLKKENK